MSVEMIQIQAKDLKVGDVIYSSSRSTGWGVEVRELKCEDDARGTAVTINPGAPDQQFGYASQWIKIAVRPLPAEASPATGCAPAR